MKIGDYETTEFALKEFIEKNKDHDLAETHNIVWRNIRIRQLYSYHYRLSRWISKLSKNKAPDNLLKLGITMVQLGEKDQDCKMIVALKKSIRN